MKSKLEVLWDFLSVDKAQRAFKRNLRKTGRPIGSYKKGSKILVESLQIPSNQIALNLFLEAYNSIVSADLVAYRMAEEKRFSEIKAKLRHRFSILRTMGVNRFLFVGYNSKESMPGIRNLYATIENNEQLEDFTIDGILVGDLIYDLFLTRKRSHTLELHNPEVFEIFDECIQYFYIWKDYLENNNVEAVIVSHCVYHLAIPARIAIAMRIKVFTVQTESIFKLHAENLHAYTSSRKLKLELSNLDENELIQGRTEARENLQRRFSGDYVAELEYSSGKAFRKSQESETSHLPPKLKQVMNGLRPKVLVTTHDFIDSVHYFGKAFYPDFYLWLKRLGELSHSLDYDWLIKIHPDARGAKREIVESVARTSKNFHVLPEEVGHHEILELDISAVLTIHGTIGTEYPYFGVPVVNASLNNPHSAFGFTVTPTSKLEYEELLFRLEELVVPDVKKEITEYLYARHMFHLKTWIYQDYALYLKEIGGFPKSMGKDAYLYYLKGTNQRPHSEVESALHKFILSGDYRLLKKHFD